MKDDYVPGVFVLSGKFPKRACDIVNCFNIALKSQDDKKYATRCIAHGGGLRCFDSGVHAHDGRAPLARYIFSDNVQVNGYARPELVGKPACMTCLKMLDPTNVRVRIAARKEDILLAAIAQSLYEKGYGQLVAVTSGIAVHDCPEGPSRRRKDLALNMRSTFLCDFENDENQHFDRPISCERRKLAGHLIDRGAVGMTHEEGKLWSDDLPDDIELENRIGTKGDTIEMRDLRTKRAAVIVRLERELRLKRYKRARGDDEGIVPRLHVIRFNCDDFVDDDGIKRGGLFKVSKITDDKPFKIDTTKAFQPAVDLIAMRIIEIYNNALDDDWVAKQPELVIEYWRYDGCRRDGYDAHGRVAASQAARRADEDASAR